MLLETLKKLGITDIKVLPESTQMKIADYNRFVKSPLGNDAEGNPSVNKAKRLNSLAKDVIFEAKYFLKTEGKTPPNIDEQEIDKKEPVQKVAVPVEGKPVSDEKKGFLEGLLGW